MKKMLVSVLSGRASDILKTLVPILVELIMKDGGSGQLRVTIESEATLQKVLNRRTKGVVNPELERLLRELATEVAGRHPETQTDIARALGLHDASVRNLLNGHLRFTSTFFDRIKHNVGSRASLGKISELQSLILEKWKR